MKYLAAILLLFVVSPAFSECLDGQTYCTPEGARERGQRQLWQQMKGSFNYEPKTDKRSLVERVNDPFNTGTHTHRFQTTCIRIGRVISCN